MLSFFPFPTSLGPSRSRCETGRHPRPRPSRCSRHRQSRQAARRPARMYVDRSIICTGSTQTRSSQRLLGCGFRSAEDPGVPGPHGWGIPWMCFMDQSTLQPLNTSFLDNTTTWPGFAPPRDKQGGTCSSTPQHWHHNAQFLGGDEELDDRQDGRRHTSVDQGRIQNIQKGLLVWQASQLDMISCTTLLEHLCIFKRIFELRADLCRCEFQPKLLTHRFSTGTVASQPFPIVLFAVKRFQRVVSGQHSRKHTFAENVQICFLSQCDTRIA